MQVSLLATAKPLEINGLAAPCWLFKKALPMKPWLASFKRQRNGRSSGSLGHLEALLELLLEVVLLEVLPLWRLAQVMLQATDLLLRSLQAPITLRSLARWT